MLSVRHRPAAYIRKMPNEDRMRASALPIPSTVPARPVQLRAAAFSTRACAGIGGTRIIASRASRRLWACLLIHCYLGARATTPGMPWRRWRLACRVRPRALSAPASWAAPASLRALLSDVLSLGIPSRGECSRCADGLSVPLRQCPPTKGRGCKGAVAGGSLR